MVSGAAPGGGGVTRGSTPLTRATLFGVSSVTQSVFPGPVAIFRGPTPPLGPKPVSVDVAPSGVIRSRSLVFERAIQ